METAIQDRITQLKKEEIDSTAECSRLEGQLEDLYLERQKVITWARKKLITENDLEIQIAALNEQESSILRDLADKRLLASGRSDKLIKLVKR